VEIQREAGTGAVAVPVEEVLAGLNDLLQLDHDAIGAYQIAIEKLVDPNHAQQIQTFLHDHERHVRELNRMIQGLGGAPRNEPHATGPFKQALQALGSVGGDKGTLMAFRTNELQVRSKYQGYAAKARLWPPEVRGLVDRNALDEERHYRWVSELLHTPAPGSVGAAQRARELADGASRVGADAMARAAARLGTIAAREQQQGGARAKAAGAAQSLAGGMEATADFLRSPDREQLRGAIEHGVKTKPFAVLATTFVAGFLIGRVLR
jgi:rubrerythrin